MGGKSSSSSEAKTTTIQTDKRIAATDSSRVFSIEGNNNVLTDYDSIREAGAIVLRALDTQSELTQLALGQTGQAVESLSTGADRFLEFADNQTKNQEVRSLKDYLPYLLAGVSVMALSGRIKL